MYVCMYVCSVCQWCASPGALPEKTVRYATVLFEDYEDHNKFLVKLSGILKKVMSEAVQQKTMVPRLIKQYKKAGAAHLKLKEMAYAFGVIEKTSKRRKKSDAAV